MVGSKPCFHVREASTLVLWPGKSMINTVVYSTVLKGFAVSKRIDKVLAVYKDRAAEPSGSASWHQYLQL